MNYTVVLFIFLAFVLFFNYREYKYLGKGLYETKEKKALSLLQIFIFIGIVLRVVHLSYPYDVFPDEAIGGYDTWSLANYGVDQHLAVYPVYLKSWGSGQSALYAYLALPFVKLFGLSTAVFRIPMALLSSMSIIALYWSFRKTKQDAFITFLVILFVIISPWHLMKSRWALDCNIFPEIFIIGFSFFLVAYYTLPKTKQTIYYIIAFFFISLSAYGYGISWFMLPFFTIILVGFLYKRKKISIPQIIGSIITVTIVTFPLILFAKLMFLGGDQYQLGALTITKLEEGRHEATTLLGRADWLRTMLNYGKRAFFLFFLGEDFYRWNTFPFWGQYYNFLAIPFLIIYAKEIYNKIKEKNILVIDIFFLIWMIANIPIIILVEPNVNHWNSLWFPMIYFTARGVGIYLKRSQTLKKVRITFVAIACLFTVFCIQYFTYYNFFHVGPFFKGVGESIHYVKNLKVNSIHYSNADFVHGLFYDPISPYEFNAKDKYKKNIGIQLIPSYGRNYFYLQDSIIRPEKGTAYVLRNDKLNMVTDTTKFKIWHGKEYSVFWNEE